ncbi:MAG: amidohydrolase family protein [Bryobacterales bacterium]|nr:amidohydrolase family protein [Bryobacterales bacterium]
MTIRWLSAVAPRLTQFPRTTLAARATLLPRTTQLPSRDRKGAVFSPSARLLTLLTFLLTAPLLPAEPVDWLLTAAHVVTVDAQHRIIANGAVAIKGERIVAVGPRADLEKRYTPNQRLDRPDAIIAPGLINTHTHAPMSLFRGIADDLRLQDWLEKFIFPAEAKNVSAEFCRAGARLAVLEMLLSGTTTYTDMYYFEEAIAEETKAAGMRAVLGQTVIGFPVADAKTPADALKRTEAFLRKFRGDALITPAVAPHALYTNSEETLKACRTLANRFHAPLIIHLSETRRENEETRAKRGKSPTQALEALGVFDGRTLAAHGVWLDDADLAILKRRNVGIAHCPSSNMKLSSGVAPVTKMLAMGINVGLGPDGPAGSNNDFNMFEEMDLAAKLAKVSTGDPQAVPARAALDMATVLGARALGLEHEIGSIEPGKRADLIYVRTNQPHAWPMYSAESHLVYALKASDVSDVFVNGRQLVRNRVVLTLQSEQVRAAADKYQRNILSTLPR